MTNICRCMIAALTAAVMGSAGAACIVQAAYTEDGSRRIDVPFVPTPDGVVEEMLNRAQVKAGDVLYDLGCGDGRIVIAAAKRGALCTGIDMDPARITESRRNAERNAIVDRVEFKQQDLFSVRFKDASVLTLYLLPEVNLKLRPKILRELKPGTRVVSHDFDMGEWKPDHVSKVGGSDTVYLWIVPANASGEWRWRMRSGDAEETYVLTMRQRFQQAEGIVTAGRTKREIRDVRISGDGIAFTFGRTVNGRVVPVSFEGRVNGDTIEGACSWNGGSEEAPWKAKRDRDSSVSID